MQHHPGPRDIFDAIKSGHKKGFIIPGERTISLGSMNLEHPSNASTTADDIQVSVRRVMWVRVKDLVPGQLAFHGLTLSSDVPGHFQRQGYRFPDTPDAVVTVVELDSAEEGNTGDHLLTKQLNTPR